MAIRFFDMFAGIGGFRSGLHAVGGFQCIGHCEIDKYANQAYKQGVNTIGATAFMNCTNIAEINLPDSIEQIGTDAFSQCKALQNIYLSENIEIIGSSAFSNCSSLTVVIQQGTGCLAYTESTVSLNLRRLPYCLRA